MAPWSHLTTTKIFKVFCYQRPNRDLGKRNSSQALDKLRGEIDTVAPHDCMSLNFEIFEQVQVRKLLNNRSVIILDTALRGKFFNFPPQSHLNQTIRRLLCNELHTDNRLIEQIFYHQRDRPYRRKHSGEYIQRNHRSP